MDLSKKRKTDENGGPFNATADGSGSPPSSLQISPEDVRKILEPFSKEQLLEIVQSAVTRDPLTLSAVRTIANSDQSQRKLFVRGLGWETTTENLRSVFSAFGELEEAIVIPHKATGKSKGYGFVTYKHIDGAILALKEPNKKIDGRITVAQLAAAGNNGPAGGVDVSMRKIYVGHVPFEISSERLLGHFSAYGEIEEGPLGFDKQTGKATGFAFFVYKTEEGARASLVDPIKTIDGHQVNCKLATDGKKRPGNFPNAGPTGTPGEPGGPPGSMNSGYGAFAGGIPSYGGGSGYAAGPPPAHQNPHMNSQLPSGVGAGFGNQGPGQVPFSGYGGGAGSQYGGSGGSGEYGGGLNNSGSSMYRLPPSSVAMPSGGAYPDGGNYGMSGYQTQLHQPSGLRVPPGPGGMYQGMPPFY